MAEQSFDLVVIGGGPGGYVAAIRAAQLGMKTACVERDKLGGVCLNWGCIPTKALLAGAEFYHHLKHEADAWGIEADNVRHNWEKVIGRSRNVAGQMNKGIHFLFKKHKITHFEGHAHIPKQGVIEVFGPEDTSRKGKAKETLKAKHILIATGAGPRPLPGADFDGETVISSKEAMALKKQPEKLLIIGAGAIGMEFAYFYNAFGTEVTVVEMVDRLLPIEDEEVSKAIARAFKKQGIKSYTGHKTEKIERTDKGIKAHISPIDDKGKAKPFTLEADKVIVAIGVKGKYDGLFDDKLGIEIFKDHIKVDKKTYKTSVDGIYAIGDVIGPPWLAHVASEEAIVCVEKIAGHDADDIDYSSIPGCTYCNPQVASLGLTEQACKEQKLDYNVGKFPFTASGKAQALGNAEGFVKLITDKKHGEILGVHMIGENVTELIAELGLAKKLEATADEVIATIHAHPTLSEAVHEAALGTDGRMIHF
ncbi:dihydrolipoyl dehydrogenase [Phycisphaerales bacterium AB-hyl4]|uniref:Dihydrolipoyl dehydrogenase n=1 Tax=Natronomicrosphaera hydrolytica TaxID=3242702 RepID=A0ABV4U7B6_9BACT